MFIESRFIRGLLCLAWIVATAACGGGSASPNSSDTPPFVERGDFREIAARGMLRVLVPRRDQDDQLPRSGDALEEERELIAEFARRNKLEPFWVSVDSRSDLIPYLLEGKGDLIAANLTATRDRRESVSFTVPVRLVREQLITRRNDLSLDGPADLAGRRVAVRRSSSFWHTLQELKKRYPAIEIQEVPENLDTDELLHRVATRRLDVTVADSNVMAAALTYRDDLRVAFDLTQDLPVAWAVRPKSEKLRANLDRFLSDYHLTRRRSEPRTGDLAEIRDKRVLRLLTRNSSATYFLWRGRLVGFEYELVRAFAESLDVRLEVIVPRPGEDMFAMLAEGKADLIAAAMTPTDDRERRGIAYSRPYNYVSQVVVAPVGEANLTHPHDLAHRTIYVRHSSAYWNTLSRLRDSGVPLILQAAPEHLETEEIIGLVAGEIYPLTVADSHVLDIELTWRDDVKSAFPLGEQVPLAWAVRESNPKLLAAIDEFLEREYRGLTYNVLHRKYFEDPKKIRHLLQSRSNPDGRLSPYDDLIKQHAERHGFDWRMIVAQAYVESGFDPHARSFAGAVGLLQVLPSTAPDFSIDELEDPEINVRAGVRYLDWVRDRFEAQLPVRDRMWFALAGYNVGLGHVRDARRLAAQQGLNPDRWFDNVERAMLLLSRPEYARSAQHGYCRGSEPVSYVREIRATYEAYLDEFARSNSPAIAHVSD